MARQIPLPRALTAEGIRRYGFHGLSYEYVAGRVDPALATGRVIIAHLGNGASLCALQGRGSIDPGVMDYLMDRHGVGPRELKASIYGQFGLLGVSSVLQNMRAL